MPQRPRPGAEETRRGIDQEDLAGLPGADLVLAGMSELGDPDPSERALLVLVAAPRLRALGLEVPERNDLPRPYEHQLYVLLERTHGPAAYSRYCSLIRRVVSFSRAFASQRGRALRRANYLLGEL
jgi:hypothetical protein